MNDVLSSRDACLRVLKSALGNDTWALKYALWTACELMDLGTLNDLLETVEGWDDVGALSGEARRLAAVTEERFQHRP